MTILNIVLLGIVQGLAELLPVSSSAHVVVAEKLLGLDPTSPPMTLLLVMLHTGTMFAVIVYFWRQWRSMLFANRSTQRGFIVALVLATLVTALVGEGLVVLLEHTALRAIPHAQIEDLFGRLGFIAPALAAVGVLIIVAGLVERRRALHARAAGPGGGSGASGGSGAGGGSPAASSMALSRVSAAAAGGAAVAALPMARAAEAPVGDADADAGAGALHPAADDEMAAPGARISVLIGAVQGLSLPFRGFSRSGSTISAGMLLGVSKARAEVFSFALAVVLTPPVVAREALRLWHAQAAGGGADLAGVAVRTLLGAAVAFVAGLAALRWLSRWLERGRWHLFGIYCLAAALAVALLHHAGF